MRRGRQLCRSRRVRFPPGAPSRRGARGGRHRYRRGLAFRARCDRREDARLPLDGRAPFGGGAHARRSGSVGLDVRSLHEQHQRCGSHEQRGPRSRSPRPWRRRAAHAPHADAIQTRRAATQRTAKRPRAARACAAPPVAACAPRTAVRKRSCSDSPRARRPRSSAARTARTARTPRAAAQPPARAHRAPAAGHRAARAARRVRRRRLHRVRARPPAARAGDAPCAESRTRSGLRSRTATSMVARALRTRTAAGARRGTPLGAHRAGRATRRPPAAVHARPARRTRERAR